MSRELRCEQGHTWTVTEEDFASRPGSLACPFCSAPHRTLDHVSEGPTLASTDVAPGTHRLPVIPGYQLLAMLGEGGMGAVFKARHLALNRLVALKVIHPERGGEQSAQRFRTEAEAVAALRHPNIIQVYEVGEHAGEPFLSLEYAEGGSLADRLRQNPLTPREAARIVRLLAEAMQAAHDAKILHRDLKPANVLLSADGQPKISDFGLAKKLEDPSGPTRTGAILGTPSYMAPEQASGGLNEVGPQADMYSLGAILYECVTGRPPFRAATAMETLYQVLQHEPISPRQLNPSLDRDLETIVLKCLHKEPRQRYASAAALGDELQRYLEGRPITARPIGPLGRLGRWCRRNPAVAALLAVVLCSLSGGFAVSTYFYVEADARARDALDAEGRERDRAREASENAIRATQQQEAAERNERQALRLLYGARIAAGHRAWQDANFGDLQSAIDASVPTDPSKPDFRNFEWGYLCYLADPPILTVRTPWHHLEFSADGRTFAGLEFDTIEVGDTLTGKRVARVSGDRLGEALAISSSRRWLVAARADNVIQAWDVQAAKPRWKLLGHAKRIQTVVLSPDDRLLASGGEDGAVRVWDLETGQLAWECPYKVVAPHLAFALDSSQLAVAGIVFSPPGAAQKSVHHVRLHDSRTGKLERELGPFRFPIWAIEYAGPGWLLSVDRTPRMTIWDVPTGKELATYPVPLDRAHCLAHAPGSRAIAFGGEDRIVHVWNWELGKRMRQYRAQQGTIRRLAWLPGQPGRPVQLAVHSADTAIRVWPLERDTESEPLPTGAEPVDSLRYGPGGKVLAACQGANIRCWIADQSFILDVKAGGLNALAFHPDGKLLAFGSNAGEIGLWDWTRKVEVAPPFRVGRTINDLVYSPDGASLAAVVRDGGFGELRVLDAGTRKARFRFASSLPGQGVVNPVYSSDGRWLATACENGSPIVILDAATGKVRHTFEGHGARIAGLAFHPREPLLASASSDKTVRLWDIRTGKEEMIFRGHAQSVHALAFSPDGERLASGSYDQTIKLWDVRTGQEFLSLSGHQEPVQSLAFHPLGKALASGGEKSLRIWPARGRP